MQLESLPYVAVTDPEWFGYLSRAHVFHPIDEVNFWQPKALIPMRRMLPGTPVFFKLRGRPSVIAGYGFFVTFQVLSLDTAWEWFGLKNGDPDERRFLQRMSNFRKVDLLDPHVVAKPLGCNVLRSPVFWPQERWIPWGSEQGWHSNIVQGATLQDVAQRERLLGEIARDGALAPPELSGEFEPVTLDGRRMALVEQVVREGQGSFRARLLEVYEGQCAITGEHTQPVLDAAHVQPYLGPASNHVQNGLLLTKELHALFDRGYVTVTPDHHVRVSKRLRADWNNGRRYEQLDGKPLAFVPRPALRPSSLALEWHGRERYLG